MRNIKLLLEYNGARYSGWQQQENADTIEGRLLDAADQLLGKRHSLRVAGRTDAGVHAIGQVASFHTESRVAIARFAPGLNNFLPDDISVHEAIEVPTSFDARDDSKSKRYGYRAYSGPQPAALELERAWQMRDPLDIEAMRRAALRLIGHLDFEAFRSAHCDAAHARRHMYSIDITRYPRPPRGEHLKILFHANAYCRYMCRIIAGTLIEVGRGKRSIDSVQETLESRDRTRAGMTAPPNGLTLLEVLY
ncbi:tRNA pseudouridine(38-40) synthase TruA [Myxococcota bacterium]